MAQPSRSTQIIARIAGPLLLTSSVMLLFRGAVVSEALETILRDPAMTLMLGSGSLAAGLAILALHEQRWSGPAQASVSLLGCLLLVRGALMLLAPDLFGAAAGFLLEQSFFFYIASGLCLALGAWFAFIGFYDKLRAQGSSQ